LLSKPQGDEFLLELQVPGGRMRREEGPADLGAVKPSRLRPNDLVHGSECLSDQRFQVSGILRSIFAFNASVLKLKMLNLFGQLFKVVEDAVFDVAGLDQVV
jgi:hypothetical protein